MSDNGADTGPVPPIKTGAKVKMYGRDGGCVTDPELFPDGVGELT